MREVELIELLDRFKKGECTLEELSKLQAWFDSSSKTGSFYWTENEKSEFSSNLKGRIDASIDQTESFRSRNWLKVAASIIVIFTLSMLVYTYRADLRDRFDPVIYARTIVPFGEKVKLTLSDGSVVILNGGSRLYYPEKFNRETRKVILEGEAYFDIIHNKEKPFIIETGGAQTQVLGTAFNIRSYSALSTIDVTVTRGKVAVSKKDSQTGAPVFLLPNEQVSIDRFSLKMEKRHINAREIISWTQGRLVFNNELLKNVGIILQNSYGVKINYKNQEVEDIRFTGSFDQQDSLNEILYSIAKANKLVYLKEGKQILFKKKYKLFN